MGKEVTIDTEQGVAKLDGDTGMLLIQHADGGVTLSKGGVQGLGAAIKAGAEPDESDWDENLCQYLSEFELADLGSSLLDAIDDDYRTVSQRRADMVAALQVIGLNVAEPKSGGNDSAVEGQSVVKSPLLLEAVLNFQANAIAELLPAAGPVKMRFDGEGGQNAEVTNLVESLEKDMNHYMTTTASEYYPDTARMLFGDVGLMGAGFKKVFHCPIRRRPVSETVASENMIVNAGATDLKTADRITERFKLSQTRMKQLVAKKYFRDAQLGVPGVTNEQVDIQKAQMQGIQIQTSLPSNYTHECYTTYAFINDRPRLKPKGAEEGTPIPYRITIEKLSRQVLEIRRDWKQDDENYDRRQTFVKFPFVEALGFYGIGLAHILANTTNSLTAAWRVLLDAGMFSNFPGWIYAKDVMKGQLNSNFRVGAGQGIGVQTGGAPIGNLMMPMPYREPSATFIQLANMVTELAQRLGNAPNLQVGEGNQQAPVGTTIALLEQAQKMMAAVHKGLHAAQSEEFQLLRDLFKEDPEAFWTRNKKPSAKWNAELFMQALDNADIVPAADPNTPSHMHRIMRVIGMIQLVTAFPQLFGQAGMKEAAETALRTLGWDPDAYLQPDPPQNDQPSAADDPVGMAAVEAQKEVAKGRDETTLKKTQLEIASREKIAGAQIQQKSAVDAATHKLEQVKAISGHLTEMQKMRESAQTNALKNGAFGFGQRVI